MCMKKMVTIKENDIKSFYRKIYYYRFLRIFKTNFILDKSSKLEKENKIIVKNILNILNSKTRREKYELIHDYACQYLDNEFINKNVCGFKNDMCSCNRAKEKSFQVSSCCESLKTRIICEKFDSKRKTCSIKSLGCKLFICPYLRKHGIRYPIKNIPYLKYFLSPRQKAICITSIFQDKDITVNKLLKPYKMP